MTPARFRRRPLLACALVLVCLPALARAADSGERLFRDGVLGSGAPLRGTRAQSLPLEGTVAACVNCHRRSGLGMIEGGVLVPPIAWRYLAKPANAPLADAYTPHAQPFAANRPPYDDATLARAISEGIAPDGRRLHQLMPRYALGSADMTALIAYLHRLDAAPEPGVTDTTLHFATIVTPDADPVARAGMLDVLRKFFAQKNVLIAGASRPMQTTRDVAYRVARKWQLHVWELTGPPADWSRQLDVRQAAEPVFGVISGIGGATWEPVHAFCQRAELPCLFPNVERPVVAEDDFYSVYFSRGVLLEADLVAHSLRAAERDPGGRVVQIFRDGDVGAAAAAELASQLHLDPQSAVSVALPARGEVGAELADAIGRAARPGDSITLWLRPDDLRRLPPSPPAATVYMSGILAGLEAAPLAPAWRPHVHMTYPVDLPALRKVRMDFPHRWFDIAHVPIVADRVQVDTYLGCVILSEALGHMQDSFVRDYLLERLEALLSHRLVNGYYPRLGLAAGQRFASKGGYVVHLAGEGGRDVVPDSEWIVP